MGFNEIDKGIGINRTISMSNTKNSTARRKKRNEKGSRALFFGSNPHSKGDNLFIEGVGRFLSNQASRKTAGGIPKARIKG
jgi:hypothetical protein